MTGGSSSVFLSLAMALHILPFSISSVLICLSLPVSTTILIDLLLNQCYLSVFYNLIGSLIGLHFVALQITVRTASH